MASDAEWTLQNYGHATVLMAKVCELKCGCGARCELYIGHEKRLAATSQRYMTTHTCKACVETHRKAPGFSVQSMVKLFRREGVM